MQVARVGPAGVGDLVQLGGSDAVAMVRSLDHLFLTAVAVPGGWQPLIGGSLDLLEIGAATHSPAPGFIADQFFLCIAWAVGNIVGIVPDRPLTIDWRGLPGAERHSLLADGWGPALETASFARAADAKDALLAAAEAVAHSRGASAAAVDAAVKGAIALTPDAAPPPRDSLELRSDWRLLRWLARQGEPEMARRWAQLPLIDVSSILLRVKESRREIHDEVPSLVERPFAECILDFGWLPTETGRWGKCFVRLADWTRFVRNKDRILDGRLVAGLIHDASRVANPEEWLYLELVSYSLDGDGLYQPFYMRARLDDWEDSEVVVPYERTPGGAPTPLIEQSPAVVKHLGMMAGIALASLAYMSVCPEYLVERRPPPPATPAQAVREKKALKRKPWLVRAPTIILIEPRHAPRPRRGIVEAGHHASPSYRFHRRGGWMTLYARRYYGWPHSEAVRGAPGPLPPLAEVVYRDTGDFIAGIDAENRPRVFRRLAGGGHGLWQELAVRRTYRRDAWCGPTEYEGEDRHIYRVLNPDGGPPSMKREEEHR